MRRSVRRAHDRAHEHPHRPRPLRRSPRLRPDHLVEVRDLRRALRQQRGAARRVLRGAPRRALRPPRHQRRRQDDDRRDPAGSATRRRRLRVGPRPRPGVRRRPAATSDRAPAPGRRAPRPDARRRGARPVRLAAPVAAALDELAAEWQLAHLLRRPFSALSGGERQRLFVALALVGRPELVFLDELTQNLDPVGRRHTWDVIRRVRDAGTTVVLVTHDVEEAERLCDRIVILDGGRIVADGSPSAITAELGGLGRPLHGCGHRRARAP